MSGRLGLGAVFVISLSAVPAAASGPRPFRLETSSARSVSGPPREFATADLDADGFLDVVTLHAGGLTFPNHVVSLRGRSDGVLLEGLTITLPGTENLQGIALADVDGDELPDLLA